MNVLERVEELQIISDERMKGTHPILRNWTLKIIEVAAYSGLYYGVHMAGRSWALQDALYAQGRKPLWEVNGLRSLAGLKALLGAENQRTVTNAPAGSSWHNYFLAVDLVEDGDPSRAGIQWSWQSTTNYIKLGKLIQAVGNLGWGGLWKSIRDYPHIELTGGLTIAEARLIYQKSRNHHDVWARMQIPEYMGELAA